MSGGQGTGITLAFATVIEPAAAFSTPPKLNRKLSPTTVIAPATGSGRTIRCPITVRAAVVAAVAVIAPKYADTVAADAEEAMFGEIGAVSAEPPDA